MMSPCGALVVANRVQQAHFAASSIDCPEDIDQPDCSPPTSFRGTKVAQADTGMLCPMIPITHRTRATKKRLRKLRQVISDKFACPNSPYLMRTDS
jgi:hypothetical protein